MASLKAMCRSQLFGLFTLCERHGLPQGSVQDFAPWPVQVQRSEEVEELGYVQDLALWPVQVQRGGEVEGQGCSSCSGNSGARDCH